MTATTVTPATAGTLDRGACAHLFTTTATEADALADSLHVSESDTQNDAALALGARAIALRIGLRADRAAAALTGGRVQYDDDWSLSCSAGALRAIGDKAAAA